MITLSSRFGPTVARNHGPTAEDVMTQHPGAISQDATSMEAAALLCARRFSALPVIDEVGRPVGVLNGSDLVRHQTAVASRLRPMLAPADGPSSPFGGEDLKAMCRILAEDRTPVREIMTPVVHLVRTDTPARRVAESLLELDVHRLYVVDEDDTLVGVISALDVLRLLGS